MVPITQGLVDEISVMLAEIRATPGARAAIEAKANDMAVAEARSERSFRAWVQEVKEDARA